MQEVELRVGLCGVGNDAYWPQFEGLEARLYGYAREVEERLRRAGARVENLGFLDTPQRSRDAGHASRRADIDLLVIYVATYGLSSTVLPVVKLAKVPVLVLTLQPAAAIDYEAFNRLPGRTAMTGEWLAYCAACPLPEIANLFARARIPFHQVTGVLTDEALWAEVEDWIAAARVTKALASASVGLMGHYYGGMLDIQTDLTQVAITFGVHLEHLEVDELSSLREGVSEEEIAARVCDLRSHFDIQPDCTSEELAGAAQTSVALDRLVAAHDLGAMAYYYKGTGVAVNENTISSIILGTSMLTARGIPVAGEYEVKNVLAMKIMDCLGAGGSFTEFYAIDLNLDHVLMGHDGPGHTAIADSRAKVRPLAVYHGKVGSGLSVEMSVKHGPVTVLSVVEDAARGFKLLAAEGESVPGEVLRIGNTNSHYRFPIGARSLVERWTLQGPAHHCAVGVGHLAARLDKVASLIGIPFVQIC